ncbi:MAG TPA: sigma-70 family RNA polymerase sigma factor [Gaiellaceae bacterium]|nr:sigma-70 family RNA polymerase sigma factor [Gaiellaceae bacterium]
MSPTGVERDRLIETHLPVARLLAGKYARRRDQKDELAQVGALALIRAIDRCDPERPEVGAYLARCVEGEIRHYLRDRASVVRVPRAAPPGEVAFLCFHDDVALPLEGTEDALLDRAALAGAVRHLDERERRILLLLYFGDLTQAETAALLGLSQAHVSRLVGGALRKLRRRLQDVPLSHA